MKEWLQVCLALCAFGYFKEFRPSDSFLVDYLTGPWVNVSAEVVYQTLTPVFTYSYLTSVILTFLVINFLCYKPLIILCGLSGVVCLCFFIWFTNWSGLIVTHVTFGIFMATEIAYYTYIYAKVDKEHYQKVTAYTRATVLAGTFSSSVLGQVLIFMEVMDSRQLHYITLGALVIATVLAFLLPPVPKSFNRSTKYNTFQERSASNNKAVLPTLQEVEFANFVVRITFKQKVIEGGKLLWSQFLLAYTQTEMILWSLCYLLAMAAYGQVRSYIQILWQDIEPDVKQTAIWNGATEATLTILGAVAALLAGYVKIGALHFGLLTIAVCSLLEGGAIILAAEATTLWMSYGAYVSAGVLYNFMITFSSYKIAKHLIDDSFGFIFGINTLIALSVQSILTVVVISEGGFSLPPRGQFRVYGGYFVVLGAVYFIAAAVSYFRRPN